MKKHLGDIKYLLDDVWEQLTHWPIYRGRLSRGQYALTLLTLTLLSSIIGGFCAYFGYVGGVISLLISFITFVLWLGLSARRCHDIGHSSRFYLKTIAAIFGILIFSSLLIFYLKQFLWTIIGGGIVFSSLLQWVSLTTIVLGNAFILLFIIFTGGLFLIPSRGENKHGANAADRFMDIHHGSYIFVGVLLFILLAGVGYMSGNNVLLVDLVGYVVQQALALVNLF